SIGDELLWTRSEVTLFHLRVGGGEGTVLGDVPEEVVARRFRGHACRERVEEDLRFGRANITIAVQVDAFVAMAAEQRGRGVQRRLHAVLRVERVASPLSSGVVSAAEHRAVSVVGEPGL